MNEPINLYVEQNENGRWSVYFRQPFQGRETLDTFDDRQEAIDYAQDQMDSASEPGEVVVNDL
jgi:hypothetical protein